MTGPILNAMAARVIRHNTLETSVWRKMIHRWMTAAMARALATTIKTLRIWAPSLTTAWVRRSVMNLEVRARTARVRTPTDLWNPYIMTKGWAKKTRRRKLQASSADGRPASNARRKRARFPAPTQCCTYRTNRRCDNGREWCRGLRNWARPLQVW